jgi:WD40 repeat protein
VNLAPDAGPVKIDPPQTHVVQELKHPSPLLGCRIDPSGQYVFAGAQDNAVVRWHLASAKKEARAGHKSWIRAFAFASKEKLVFSGDYTGRILTWSIEGEPTPLRTLDAHKGWLRALAVSPDGKTLASCGNDHAVRLWSISDGKLLRELAGHDCHVYNTGFHPQGRYLVSADLKGVIKVWDLATGVVERELDARVLHKYDVGFQADIGGVRGMAFSPDGAFLASAGITDVTNAFAGVGKPVIVLFDWPTGKVRHLLRPRENYQGTAWGVAFHRDGFLVGVGGGNGGMLWFWKPDKAQDFFALKLPANGRDIDLHPDGRRFAVACADGAVRLYEMGPKK